MSTSGWKNRRMEDWKNGWERSIFSNFPSYQPSIRPWNLWFIPVSEFRYKPPLQRCRHSVFVGTLLSFLLMVTASAQNPPAAGNPYVPRGNPRSSDGKYEWTVRTTDSIRYELVDLSDGKVVAMVSAYRSEANNSNIRYAKACGFFWNNDGTLVALDELNRRREGYLYFFVLHNGTVRRILSANIMPLPPYAVDGRNVVDPGWLSATKIRVRQALKTKRGEFLSRYFTIDFANPSYPTVQKD